MFDRQGGIQGNSWWGCAAWFSNLSCFHTRFQTWPLKSIPFIRPGVARNYVIITYLVLIVNIYNIYNQNANKKKIHFEFAYYSFFLIHLKLKRQIRSCPSRIPSKTIPEFRPKWAKSILLSDLNGAKTIPFGVAHTHKANIREYTSQGLEAGKREGKALHWKSKCFASVGNEQVVILYSFRKDKLLYNHQTIALFNYYRFLNIANTIC